MKKRRRADFMPTPPIVVEGGPDVWAYVVLVDPITGNPANRLVGYTDSFKKVVDVPWNAMANGREVYFGEHSDGWMYGVFQQESSPFKYRKFKRFKVSGGSVVVESLYDLTAGLDAAPFGASAAPLFVGPDGVYMTVWDDPYDFDVEPHPFGKAWKRISSSALLNKGDVSEAVSSWANFSGGDPFGTFYSVATVTQSIKRSMVPYVLKDGRWAIADVLCDYWKPNQWLDGDASGLDKVGGPDPGAPGPDFVSTQFRAWGNAWWERANEDAALVAIANGGVSTRTADFAISQTNNQHVLRDADDDPTPMGLARNDQTAVLYLPTSRLHAVPGMELYPSGGGAEDDDLERQTWSPRWPSLVDGSYLYYMLGKDQVDDPALNGDTVSEGLYRAAIPPAGGTPSWTKIISEPDFDDSPQKQWGAMAVSAKWVWIVEIDYSGAHQRLWAYPKAGGTPNLVREDLNTGGEGRGPAVLATARRSMWK